MTQSQRYGHTTFAWLILIGLVATCPLTSESAEFYIAPGGSNAGSGAIGSPWETFDYAINQLNAGDTLFVRGGQYNLNSRLRFDSNDGGASGAPVSVFAYQDETPILDFSTMSNGLWGSSSGRGIQIDDGADWIHLRGLTIQNARDNGIWSGANNGTFEQIVTRWNGDSGVQLSGFASNNLILNTDSYENYDPSSNGENADGFAIKFEDLGPGNVVRGARAWGNSDDGWDMWESTTGGVLVEDSWAFDNGKIIQRFFDVDALEDGDLSFSNFNGDGNGFKLGQDGGPHVLNRVVVWENAVRGIDVNGNGFGVVVNNSTVYNSGRNWQFDETSSQTINQHVLTNNISFAGSQSDTFLSGVNSSFNTWNGIPVNAADFLSLDDTIARGPREADGSLPVSDFLKLAPGSNLIDAGTDVGLPFNDAAPDLGAYETGNPIQIAGDANGDGAVDILDLDILSGNFGQTGGATFSDGDFNEDGNVDILDLDILSGNFGATGSTAIPEPTAALLLGALLLGYGAQHRD